LEVLERIEPVPEHPNFKDRTGTRFHNLYVMFFAGKSKCSESLYACRCDCGNYTIVASGNMRAKGAVSCGCLRVKKRTTVHETKIQDRINKVHQLTPYTVIDHGKGSHSRNKWKFECKEHGEFEAHWCDIVIKNVKCAGCALTGFDQTKPGYFYLHALYDGEYVAGYKYGITNKAVSERQKQLQAKCSYRIENILSFLFENGHDALKLETEFSSIFGKNYISRFSMKSGFTETINPLKHQEAITYLKSLGAINLTEN